MSINSQQEDLPEPPGTTILPWLGVSLGLHSLLLVGIGSFGLHDVELGFQQTVAAPEVLITPEPEEPLSLSLIEPPPLIDKVEAPTPLPTQRKEKTKKPKKKESRPQTQVTRRKAHSIRNPPPRYPEGLRKKGIEGRVILSVSVNQSGSPSRVTVSRSSGYPAFDRAAIAAVKRWKFNPANVGNTPINSTVRIPISFRLR